MCRSLQGSVFQAKKISKDLEAWKAGVPEKVGRGLDCPGLRESWKRRYEMLWASASISRFCSQGKQFRFCLKCNVEPLKNF